VEKLLVEEWESSNGDPMYITWGHADKAQFLTAVNKMEDGYGGDPFAIEDIEYLYAVHDPEQEKNHEPAYRFTSPGTDTKPVTVLRP